MSRKSRLKFTVKESGPREEGWGVGFVSDGYGTIERDNVNSGGL